MQQPGPKTFRRLLLFCHGPAKRQNSGTLFAITKTAAGLHIQGARRIPANGGTQGIGQGMPVFTAAAMAPDTDKQPNIRR